MDKLAKDIKTLSEIPVAAIKSEPVLSETDWRMIHNALANEQSRGYHDQPYRLKLQVVMDKVRDNFISK